MIIFNNYAFWSSLFSVVDASIPRMWLFLIACFAVIFAVSFTFISIFGVAKVLKPLISLLFLVAACTSYYMDAYGTVFDDVMVRNMTETTIHEARELFDVNFIVHVILVGVVPILILYRINIIKLSALKSIRLRIISVVIIAAISYALVYSTYKDFTFIFRENREISFFINPVYPLRAVYRFVEKKYHNRNRQFLTILEDAHVENKNDKYNVLVLVVGETARAQSFSLNGYDRNTNPNLTNIDVINFGDVSSCGTATAISLPCMFSDMSQETFNNNEARDRQNLLDGLDVAGIDVIWVDNNPDCKGVCDRIETLQEEDFSSKKYCNDGQCYDEALLIALENIIKNVNNNSVIVLHMQGSHGPGYYRRYPERFRQFLPECRHSAVQDCTDEEVINAYDNTILYTDFFVSQVINALQKKANNLNSAMLYVSDHGESLGENGVYLHGLPYFMAPEYQTKVPMIFWMSQSFTEAKSINSSCLSDESEKTLSHDYYFHSVLGLMDVRTARYDAQLDIFSSCRPKS